jgi:hypothetical protein
MNAKTWLGALVPVALVAIVGSGGCGTGVATCASICALPDAPSPSSTCTTSCMNSQAAATAPGAAADFQDYLTCVENEGTYLAVSEICAPQAKTVVNDTHTMISPPVDGGNTNTTSDADSTGDSTAPSTCATATCASVCATEGTESADCASGCAASESECPNAGADFQAVLTCICQNGGLTPSTSGNISLECETQLTTLEVACPAIAQEDPDASIGVVMPGVGTGVRFR